MNDKKTIAYIGTYTTGESEGIYSYELNSNTGELIPMGLAAKLENPSYVILSSDNKYLYSVAEVDSFGTDQCGAVAAFSIDDKNGSLTFLNYMPTKGKTPCHICTNKENSYLFAANYKDGTVTSFSLEKDGSIKALEEIKSHRGSGPNKQRQEKAHAHFVTFTPEEKYLCAIDLGMDRIQVYGFVKEKAELKLRDDLSVKIKSGSGPRHMIFHPNNSFAYAIDELTSDVVIMKYSETGFKVRSYISALPEDFKGESTAAAIHLSPEGRYLYTSNRGDDSIAVFKVNELSGDLALVQHISSKGSGPRDFSMDPTGSFLYAANQYSSNIAVFSVDKASGKLTDLNIEYKLPNPVCVKFCAIKTA